MKTTYIKPSTEAVQIETCSLMQAISGLGLQNGGQAGTAIIPQ